MNHKMPKPQNETKSLNNQGEGHFSIFRDTTPPLDNRKDWGFRNIFGPNTSLWPRWWGPWLCSYANSWHSSTNFGVWCCPWALWHHSLWLPIIRAFQPQAAHLPTRRRRRYVLCNLSISHWGQATEYAECIKLHTPTVTPAGFFSHTYSELTLGAKPSSTVSQRSAFGSQFSSRVAHTHAPELYPVTKVNTVNQASTSHLAEPQLLQPGRAETRTRPMTWGCGKLCPCDSLCKHAEGTFLGAGQALCSTSLPAPASIHMETKQDVPDQQQSFNFTPSLGCADQTHQYSYSLMIPHNFCQ